MDWEILQNWCLLIVTDTLVTMKWKMGSKRGNFSNSLFGKGGHLPTVLSVNTPWREKGELGRPLIPLARWQNSCSASNFLKINILWEIIVTRIWIFGYKIWETEGKIAAPKTFLISQCGTTSSIPRVNSSHVASMISLILIWFVEWMHVGPSAYTASRLPHKWRDQVWRCRWSTLTSKLGWGAL